MEGRRVRRFGRRNTHSHNPNILPISHYSHPHNNLTHSLSCWYCDYKISAFSEPLYRFGRNHARFLKGWFSVGVGFSLAALIAVTLVLLWELGRSLHIFKGGSQLSNLCSSLLFGFSPSVSYSGMSISLANAVYLFISTVVSISFHEFGHALSAASEGIQIEYIAVFIAVLFPGALVALNNDFLQALPHISLLRVYSAGIWHNAVLCAVCGFLLFLLPMILSPFYIHGDSPMVLDVSSMSPLSSYLSPGDVIAKVDGVPIYTVQDWLEVTALIGKGTLQSSNYSETYYNRKGYCVPNFMLKESNTIQLYYNQSACQNYLTAFLSIPCSGSSALADDKNEDDLLNRQGERFCLSGQDIVKLKKCGDGVLKDKMNGTGCTCSENEYCLAPIQTPGMNWVEITYYRPSAECLSHSQKFPNFETSDKELNCGGTFVFVGDVVAMEKSVYLTAYRPRWDSTLGAHLPTVVEKIMMCNFHISLTLALLNSLPVYFLDGESILEVILQYSPLSSRKKKRVLQLCLLGGTIFSICTFLRIFYFRSSKA